MSQDIEDWAIERALTRFPRPYYFTGRPWTVDRIRNGGSADFAVAVRFMASQIAEHEEAPADRLLIEARSLCAAVCDDLDDAGGLKASAAHWREKYLSGECDRNKDVQRVLAALKRESGKGQPHAD